MGHCLGVTGLENAIYPLSNMLERRPIWRQFGFYTSSMVRDGDRTRPELPG
jgi:hypothetical protein